MPLSVPHILLLVTDQLRFDVVTPDITPNLYRLAQHSTVFRNAYTSTPSCTPARAGLLTGKSPWAHGMLSYTDFTNCTNYPTTLPKVLTEYFNYTTACVGKNHFGPNTTQGYQDVLLYDGLSFYQDDYDEWFRKKAGDDMDPLATCGLEWNDWKACPYVYEEYFHPTAWTTRTAIEYFQNYTSNDSLSSPLFLKVSYHRPHSPYDPPRRIFKQYLEGGPKSHLPQLDRFLNNTSWDRQYRDIPMTRSASAGDPGPEAARHTRAGYLANIEFVDEGVGQLLDALEGHLGDFMILWVSDHGDMNGDHYLWRKRYPWEASAHIPMMIKSPAIIRNNNATTAKRPSRPQHSGALVELRDIAPTIYDFLGILESVQQRDPLLNGKSLLPVVNGTSHGVREWLDLEHGSMNNYSHHFNALVGYADEAQAVCKYLWKYIFYAHDGSEQLFCLSKDPNETFDLVMEYPEILKLWRQRMVDQFEQEGRGEAWVKNGKLQIRRESTTFGPHYPCHQRKGASGDHFLRNSIS